MALINFGPDYVHVCINTLLVIKFYHYRPLKADLKLILMNIDCSF